MKKNKKIFKSIVTEWIDNLLVKRLDNLLEADFSFLKSPAERRKEEIFRRIKKGSILAGTLGGSALSIYGLLKLYKKISSGLMKIYDRGTRNRIMKEVEEAIKRGEVEKAEKLKQYLDMYEAGQISRTRLTTLILTLLTLPVTALGAGIGGVIGGDISGKVAEKLINKLNK